MPQYYPHITAALDKIYEELVLIHKSISVSQNTAKLAHSYADAVKMLLPAAHVPTEMFMLSGLLNEVTVK
jgi:hypothetical protein